jgi:hypothetical protein
MMSFKTVLFDGMYVSVYSGRNVVHIDLRFLKSDCNVGENFWDNIF